MKKFSISGDNCSINISIHKYERLEGNIESDLNWISAIIESDFVHFKCLYNASLTTYDLEDLQREICDLINEKKNRFQFQADEDGLCFSVETNKIGNYVVKGYLKNIAMARVILNFEFESNYSYMNNTKKQLENVMSEFKIKKLIDQV